MHAGCETIGRHGGADGSPLAPRRLRRAQSRRSRDGARDVPPDGHGGLPMSVSVRPRRRSLGGLIPLLGLLWLVYNAIVLLGASPVLEAVVSSFTLPSGAVWTMRGGEVLV